MARTRGGEERVFSVTARPLSGGFSGEMPLKEALARIYKCVCANAVRGQHGPVSAGPPTPGGRVAVAAAVSRVRQVAWRSRTQTRTRTRGALPARGAGQLVLWKDGRVSRGQMEALTWLAVVIRQHGHLKAVASQHRKEWLNRF